MGGAETLCGDLAVRCSQAGDQVDILTTTARDNRTWENYYSPGVESYDSDVTIRRFKVSERNLDVWIPLQVMISENRSLNLEEQVLWMEHSLVSLDLFEWIVKHPDAYDALIFAPYLLGTTFWGALLNPKRSILLPCLHDEPYAYQGIMTKLFTSVAGCIFNVVSEQRLCERLYGKVRGGVVGMGFSELPFTLPNERRHRRPYLLYLGRKETGKNADLLIDLFLWYISVSNNQELDLLIVGGGEYSDLHRDRHERVIDLPHVSEEEKNILCRDALLLVQPSTNESFSIVLMEAWRVGTPCLVNGSCAATYGHVDQSKGGLYFNDARDFYVAVEGMVRTPELRSELGNNGQQYVKNEYSWHKVMQRFNGVYESIMDHA
jgi:glycosyltransferase involved in cell wall biosynthesis